MRRGPQEIAPRYARAFLVPSGYSSPRSASMTCSARATSPSNRPSQRPSSTRCAGWRKTPWRTIQAQLPTIPYRCHAASQPRGLAGSAVAAGLTCRTKRIVPPSMTSRRPSASPRRTPTPTAAEAWRGHASASTATPRAMPRRPSSTTIHIGGSPTTPPEFTHVSSPLPRKPESRKTGPAVVRLVTRYQDRAFELVRLALQRAPAEQRSALFRDTILADPALQPIHRRLRSLESLKLDPPKPTRSSSPPG